VVHAEYNDYIAGLSPQKNGTIVLDDYKPNHLTYSSNTASDQFAVFSEIWYGPDKGWQAYLDGEPVDHIRVNYLLRGMKIPPGQHKVEFKFEPAVYSRGKTISFISSLLILLGLIGVIAKSYPKWKEEMLTASVPVKKEPIAPTKSSKAKKSQKQKPKSRKKK